MKRDQGAVWLLVALGVFALGAAGCKKSEAAPGKARPAVARVKVETAAIAERPVPRVVPLTGTLAADLRSELTANASGRVVKTFVERGQRVTKGAPLAQLDVRAAAASAAEAHAGVVSAQVQLEAAKAECARYDALVERGAITRQEHERQKASCKQQAASVAVSQARAASASIAVIDGTIRAPFDGLVSERLINVGDYVQPPTRVATLVVSGSLRLLLTVPERRMPEIKEGLEVHFSPASMPGRSFTGSVKYMSGEVRQATRDVVVEAMVPNPDGALLPGMFVHADLVAGHRPMPVAPRAAVFAVGQQKSVFVVKEGHLEQRVILAGAEVGDSIAIEAGASTGELVVVNPAPSMTDGALVE